MQGASRAEEGSYFAECGCDEERSSAYVQGVAMVDR
jgi:hypothetical protein